MSLIVDSNSKDSNYSSSKPTSIGNLGDREVVRESRPIDPVDEKVKQLFERYFSSYTVENRAEVGGVAYEILSEVPSDQLFALLELEKDAGLRQQLMRSICNSNRGDRAQFVEQLLKLTTRGRGARGQIFSKDPESSSPVDRVVKQVLAPQIQPISSKLAKKAALICVGGFGAPNVTKSIQRIQSLDQGKTFFFDAIGFEKGWASIDEIITAVKSVKEKGQPITLFLWAHGKAYDGETEHYVQLAGINVPTRDLFQALKKALDDEIFEDGYPLTLFMFSCHSGGSLQAVSELPKQTTLIAFCGKDEQIYANDAQYLIDNLPTLLKSWRSKKEALYLYLTKSLQNRRAPIIALGGPGAPQPFDLGKQLQAHVGKRFTEEEKKHIHQHLAPFMKDKAISKIIQAIEAARRVDDIKDKDYGPALAVILAKYTDKRLCDQFFH